MERLIDGTRVPFRTFRGSFQFASGFRPSPLSMPSVVLPRLPFFHPLSSLCNSHYNSAAAVKTPFPLHSAISTATELRKFREKDSAHTAAVAGQSALRSELLN